DFFDRPASCHKAVALFALANQAPLMVIYARRDRRPLHFEIRLVGMHDPQEPQLPLDTVPELTQWYNRLMETMIRHWPQQYWWLHRRWKDTRKKKQLAA
ncbi:MAG: lipid A biosynthesis acyltransferase, partial [Planctomycetales bacterium]|nr:lipid A biosynthesis acyltransferase [Planctomycetales bacterium]